MAFNLIRNSRVFYTSNVDTTTGAVKTTGFTTANTREIQVLEGFSFSQNTTSETVTLNEAGAAPVRGQRSFNTALDPADFSFTTYMRPQDAGTNITAEEAVLWNAMFSATEYGTTYTPITAGSFVPGTKYTITALTNGSGGATTSFTTIGASANTVGVEFTATGVGTGTGTATPVATQAWADGTTSATCTVANSDKHQLLPFGMIIVVDATTFVIDNCVLNTATIDFGLDAIASVQWAGQGGTLRQITSPTIASVASGFSVASVAAVTGLTGMTAGGPFTILPEDITAPQIAGGAKPVLTFTATSATAGTVAVVSAGSGYTTAPTVTVRGTLAGGSTTATPVVTLSTTSGSGSLSGSVAGNFLQKVTTCPYIANKLSIVTLDAGIGVGGTAYTIPITGGSLTISNNVTYLTPANLATVNKPVTYFTSTRAISGSLNAYLRTGTGFSADLMKTMLDDSATAVNPAFYMNISVGGTGSTKVDFTMPAVVLTIPTVNAEQVVSTTINFTAQGYAGSNFDIGAANELSITYTTPNV